MKSRSPARRIVVNQRGFALMQALMMAAMIGALITGVLSLHETQIRNQAQLKQKLAALDVERTVSNALQDAAVCGHLFTRPVPSAFDPGSFADKPLRAVAFPTLLPSQADPASTPLLNADSAEAVSSLDETLTVRSMSIEKLTCTPGPCTSASERIDADLVVNFNARGPLAPLRIPLTLAASGPDGSKRLVGCHRRTPVRTVTVYSEAETCGGAPDYPNCPEYDAAVVATCPPGYVVSGCGFRVSKWDPRPTGNTPEIILAHSNAPDSARLNGNGCSTWAGGAPACGVCFRAQAMCIRKR